jgi:hypothetical protein
VNAPVVTVTRDEVRIFEDERHFYLGAASVVLEFNREHSVWTGTTLRFTTRPVQFEAELALWRLTRNPWTDVSDQATHYIPEPGAPLEPIPGRAA